MAPNGTCQPYIDISTLPDISKAEMDFLDSSFFQSDKSPRPQLPTPTSIIQQYGDGGARVVKIESLNIAVKINHASYLRLEEAQTIRVIRQIFPNGEVPVPELFGWRRHGDQIFIYMSLIHGQTLREAWSSLTEDEKVSIRNELGQIVTSLRLDYEEGPFLAIKSFNDWLFAAATRQRPGPNGIPGLDHPYLYRDLIPDTGNIYFTHGDLTLGNIIVSATSGFREIKAIIDWEQAGWYPEYWEYCKMLYGVELDHEWRTEEWPDKIVKPFEDAIFAFAEYSSWRCPY
ncbi:hypothetical protein QQZ08_002700 [Neonectria magnoliae]|uniref:Aminoglycoside phosphotransferase domain-containing protein n=1 Tax=Neonectria magnoliae TaxID=2732573 RepID=A0ABR1IAM6_9HYPO